MQPYQNPALYDREVTVLIRVRLFEARVSCAASSIESVGTRMNSRFIRFHRLALLIDLKSQWFRPRSSIARMRNSFDNLSPNQFATAEMQFFLPWLDTFTFHTIKCLEVDTIQDERTDLVHDVFNLPHQNYRFRQQLFAVSFWLDIQSVIGQ